MPCSLRQLQPPEVWGVPPLIQEVSLSSPEWKSLPSYAPVNTLRRDLLDCKEAILSNSEKIAISRGNRIKRFYHLGKLILNSKTLPFSSSFSTHMKMCSLLSLLCFVTMPNDCPFSQPSLSLVMHLGTGRQVHPSCTALSHCPINSRRLGVAWDR